MNQLMLYNLLLEKSTLEHDNNEKRYVKEFCLNKLFAHELATDQDCMFKQMFTHTTCSFPLLSILWHFQNHTVLLYAILDPVKNFEVLHHDDKFPVNDNILMLCIFEMRKPGERRTNKYLESLSKFGLRIQIPKQKKWLTFVKKYGIVFFLRANARIVPNSVPGKYSMTKFK